MSAEDILTHEDPRTAVLVRNKKKEKKIEMYLTWVQFEITVNEIIVICFNVLNRKRFRSNRPKPAACKCPLTVHCRQRELHVYFFSN